MSELSKFEDLVVLMSDAKPQPVQVKGGLSLPVRPVQIIGNSLRRVHIYHPQTIRKALDRVNLPAYTTSFLHMPLETRREFLSRLSAFTHNSLLDDVWGGHAAQSSSVLPATMRCGQPYVIPIDTEPGYWRHRYQRSRRRTYRLRIRQSRSHY